MTEEIWQYNGKHLIVDGRRRVVPGSIQDTNLVQLDQGIKLLNQIVDLIDMTLILPPLGMQFPHSKSEMKGILDKLEAEGLGQTDTANQIRKSLHLRETQSSGYTCVAVIAESHISIHTFPEHGWFTFDCYSCKDFPHELILDLLSEYFGPEIVSKSVIERTIPLFPEEIKR